MRGYSNQCGKTQMSASGEKADNVELRSFGRRRGRKPSDRQVALMRDVLPRVALDLAAPPVFANQDVWLEVGFGGGEHLVWQAQHNPDVTIIGCEPFEDGVMKVLSRIADEDLKNIRLHMGDARDVLRWLPEASISRAFVLFPDPWPKRKHRKRRLVNPSTLALLARVMKPGAELRIGTDIGDYARTILQAFSAQTEFTWLVAGPEDWRIRPFDWPETRYEQKAGREGRVRYYLRFSRVSEPSGK
jgi:tRNA (guanine-N7-)-methyltransferase